MKDEPIFPDHWDNLSVFPEWYFNNEWYDVVTPEDTIEALLEATSEMIAKETDQWKRQELTSVQDGIRILEDIIKKNRKETDE